MRVNYLSHLTSEEFLFCQRIHCCLYHTFWTNSLLRLWFGHPWKASWFKKIFNIYMLSSNLMIYPIKMKLNYYQILIDHIFLIVMNFCFCFIKSSFSFPYSSSLANHCHLGDPLILRFLSLIFEYLTLLCLGWLDWVFYLTTETKYLF